MSVVRKLTTIFCFVLAFNTALEAKPHRHGFFGTLSTLPMTAIQSIAAIPAGVAGGVKGAIKHKKPSRLVKGVAYGFAGTAMSLARILYTPLLSVYPRAFNPAIIPDALSTGHPHNIIFTYYGGKDSWRTMLDKQGKI